MARIIIDQSGSIYQEEVRTKPLSAKSRFIREMIGSPEIEIAIDENTVFHCVDNEIYFYKRLKSLPMTTDYKVMTVGDDTFEVPCFSNGDAVVTRDYLPQYPLYIVLRLNPVEERGDYLRYNNICPGREIQMHLLVPDRTDGKAVFYSPPLPNIYEDGRICSGEIPEASDFFGITENAIECWKRNKWNSDLFDEYKKELVPKYMRFDCMTGQQLPIAEVLNWREDFRMISPPLSTRLLEGIVSHGNI